MAEKKAVQARVRSVLEEPSALAVARVYAEAFLDAAQTVGVEASLEEFKSFIDDVCGTYPEFDKLLRSGLLNRDEKRAVIDRAVAPHGSEFFTNFLRVLARHDRLDLLPLILGESTTLYETRSGKRRVQVHTAEKLTPENLAKIHNRLKEFLPFEPIVEAHQDESLIGGLIVRVGDTVFDSSLKTRMKQLRNNLLHRSHHEIQSGRNRFSHPTGD